MNDKVVHIDMALLRTILEGIMNRAVAAFLAITVMTGLGRVEPRSRAEGIPSRSLGRCASRRDCKCGNLPAAVCALRTVRRADDRSSSPVRQGLSMRMLPPRYRSPASSC